MAETTKKKIAIIGAGPGGYAAAFMAADLGLDVTLTDLEPNPGGVCLHRGCIPSKVLLHIAKVLNDAREAKHWGITFQEPKIDLDKLRASKCEVVHKLTSGLGQLCKARNVHFVQGRASFEDSTTLKVVRDGYNEDLIQVDHTVVAAGSRPAALPDLYTDSPRILNSNDALELDTIPKTLLVIGGGYIGLELGSVYATLGSKVTLVEMAPTLLPGADHDLVEILAKRMESLVQHIMINTKVVDIKEEKAGITVRLEGPGIDKPEQTFDKVLVCVGRKPNSSGLGLGNTRVKIDDRGYVVVDAQRKTTDPHVFAIGDLTGEPMLAHKASHEGRIAAEVIAGHKAAFEPQAIPAVVFTDPEIAWCGLTENEAKESERPIRVARFPWGASGRASTLHRTDGLTKIITDRESERVLGVGIVGPGAGELISEGALAIEMGALAEDIRWTIHPHPTLGETIMESADLIFGQSMHMFKPPKQ